MGFKYLKHVQDTLRDAEKALGLHFRAVNETEGILEICQTVDELHDKIGHLSDGVCDLISECEKADGLIEELRATIEECEATINSLKPQTLLDEQKAEILKKLTVLDLETLQHLESVLGLQFSPPYS